MLKIVTVPNSVLTKPTKKITHIDGSIKKLVKEMEKTLDAQTDPQGVGLAAPQVGISLALFIMRPSADSPLFVMINPNILKTHLTQSTKLPLLPKSPQSPDSQNDKDQLEGCLSIPRIWSPIKRHESLMLEYRDLSGKLQKKLFEGFDATIIQHEVDHLYGILFTQRAIEQNKQLYEEQKGKLKKVEF